MNTSQSDRSSEDELLIAFNCILLIASKTTIQRWTTNDCLKQKCNFFKKISIFVNESRNSKVSKAIIGSARDGQVSDFLTQVKSQSSQVTRRNSQVRVKIKVKSSPFLTWLAHLWVQQEISTGNSDNLLLTFFLFQIMRFKSIQNQQNHEFSTKWLILCNKTQKKS